MSLRSSASLRAVLATLAVSLPTACGGDPSAANANVPIITTKASVNPDAAAEAPHGIPALPYPAARRQDLSDLHFGVPVADPYRWLEDVNSDETKAWTHAEGELARGYLDKLPGRDAFAKRLGELLYVPSMGLPLKRGKHLFYARRDPKKEKAVLCVRSPTLFDFGTSSAMISSTVAA